MSNAVFPVTAERVAILATADPELRRLVEQGSRGLIKRLAHADTIPQLRATIEDQRPDVLLVDFTLLGDDPADALSALPAEGRPPVLLLAEAGEREQAFELIGKGADDVLDRPPRNGELHLRIDRVLESREIDAHLASLEDEITERSRRSYRARTIVTRSPAMRQLADTIERVARMRTTVLVLGESGVGKELVSRSVHFSSPRIEGPFIAINCAALPPHLIESELFGHEKGAFTGAVDRRAGKFELAHGGTLFLDEIGETDLATQAKLLRVLETQEFMRVGGTRPVKVDVRLVAATNVDLERFVREGRFREDLYYRLKVVTLQIPPLRERREDIPDLISTTLSNLCRENQIPRPELSPEAMEALSAYAWPGNVRELMNTLEAVLVSNTSHRIGVAELPPSIVATRSDTKHTGTPLELVGRSLREIESLAISATLREVEGSRTRAAELLGISVRTLRRRIHELGLEEEHPARPGRPRLR